MLTLLVGSHCEVFQDVIRRGCESSFKKYVIQVKCTMPAVLGGNASLNRFACIKAVLMVLSSPVARSYVNHLLKTFLKTILGFLGFYLVKYCFHGF